MRREGTRALFAALAALFTATAAAQSDVAPNRSKVEAFAAELAAELNDDADERHDGSQIAIDHVGFRAGEILSIVLVAMRRVQPKFAHIESTFCKRSFSDSNQRLRDAGAAR